MKMLLMSGFILFFALLLLVYAAGCNHDHNDDYTPPTCPTCTNCQLNSHPQLHVTPPPTEAQPVPPAPTPWSSPPAAPNQPPTITSEPPHVAIAPLPPVIIIADPQPAPLPVIPLPDEAGTKRAVIVGINHYLDPSAPPLSGCVNDAWNIKNKCVKSWGFNDEYIILLLDAQATKAAIVAALKEYVAASKPGDTLLYWQSSHGAEDAVSDDADSEPDHANQMVCCYDFAWDRQHELIDKDFVEIFKALPAGVIFNWGSDSCHSGDLDRNVNRHFRVTHPKSPTPPDVVKIRVAKAQLKGRKHRGLTQGLLDVGFLSGCRSDQTSADTQDDNGVPCGALTNYFLKNIDAMSEASLSTLAKTLDKKLSADGYDQSPVAEGARAGKPWLK